MGDRTSRFIVEVMWRIYCEVRAPGREGDAGAGEGAFVGGTKLNKKKKCECR